MSAGGLGAMALVVRAGPSVQRLMDEAEAEAAAGGERIRSQDLAAAPGADLAHHEDDD